MADVKTAYASSASYTLTTTSLASSATLIAGRESTAVSNTTNLYRDYLIGGRVTTGTTPTAGIIEVWAYGSLNDTPLYADVLDGTDSDETFTSVNIKLAGLKLLARMVTDTTSNRSYDFGPVSLLQASGQFGVMWTSVPKFHGLFVTHSTVAALNATAGNHIFSYTGVFDTVI
jgi:hypothetical protein